MSDVQHVLARAAYAGGGTATEQEIEADLARGRRALIRVRHRRIATRGIGGLCVAAAAVGAFQLTGPGTATHASRPDVAAQGAGVQAQHEAVRTGLVAYTGQQPTGFTVAKVPPAWTVESVDPHTMLLAPPNATPQSELPHPVDAAGHTDLSSPSYVDRVMVSLRGDNQIDPADHPRQVQVNGRSATLGGNAAEGRALTFVDANGHELFMQVWAGITLSDDEVVGLANALASTEKAQRVGG